VEEPVRTNHSVPTIRKSNPAPSDAGKRVFIGPEPEGLKIPQQQFLAAVEKAMEGPFIRYSKRLQLMELAKSLRIGRFQANLLIAQVQQRTGGMGPVLTDSYESSTVPTTEPAVSGTNGRDRFFLFAALFIIAALADLALVRFLFKG
jgi:hypothetical protein